MKKIKYIICFFLLIFAFTLSGELYQNHLESFTNGVPFVVLASGKDKEKFDRIEKISNKNDCDVFCVGRNTDSSISSTVIVYCNSSAAEKVTKKCKVSSGEYKSLFSGITTVKFAEFNLADIDNETFFFFGDDENIDTLRSQITSIYGGGMVHKADKENAQWLLVALWLIFAFVLLLLTWFDIQFQKKENFVLVSLGKSVWIIIFKNIFKDVAYYISLYVLLRSILNKYTYVSYRESQVLIIFLVTLALNALLYFSIYKYDMKKALSSSNFSSAVLSNCYVIKAVALIITVVVLASNIILIKDNSNLMRQYNKVLSYDGYRFANIYYDADSDEDDDSIEKGAELAASKERNIFYELYKAGKASFSVEWLQGEDVHFLAVDKSCLNLLDDISAIKQIKWDKDYYILVPSDADVKAGTEQGQEVFRGLFEEIYKKASYETVTYKGNKNIVYFDGDFDELISGFNTVKNPVIVLCNLSNELLDYAIKKGEFGTDSVTYNFMYKIDDNDIERLKEKYDFEENRLEIISTSVTEKAEYMKAAVERIILLNTVISVFMLLLEFMIMSTTVKLEYTANSMTISIKKVLGYSMLQRNIGVFLLNLFSVFIAVFTCVAISAMAYLEIWIYALIIGVAITVLESVVICFYMLKLDKESISRILKGGCL